MDSGIVRKESQYLREWIFFLPPRLITAPVRLEVHLHLTVSEKHNGSGFPPSCNKGLNLHRKIIYASSKVFSNCIFWFCKRKHFNDED